VPLCRNFRGGNARQRIGKPGRRCLYPRLKNCNKVAFR